MDPPLMKADEAKAARKAERSVRYLFQEWASQQGAVAIATMVIAVGLALAALTLLGGCAPDPLEVAYKARVDEAQQHCRANGGDEFKPYGANAWLAMFSIGGSRPATFRCQRLEKHWKRGIAVYALRREGDTITMEIR